ncbi:hypothetical protein [Clostridium butyricum]|uniref:Uncharacterized protein n=1 Tax=Clostridium butyricum TaxID=1492 RepID=A0AAP9RCM8_CLOBU|nr:hypothetical protein [Clostridium butyricum]MBZ5747817.1 hypothetical protein [Clostridium butyricum]QMW89641.1 hypothetical protein FF104_01415 [Clostridium butyricum]BBK78301.1 hypothetical protein Cbu04g_33090 [Clostridium butyricum]GEQ26507.1 hypothetical protein CBU03nite_29300 [Clostridium butyricum]
MVYYNYGRIKAINANIKESLNDLDNAFAVYDKLKYDSNMESIIGNSIRMSFVQIREEIFSAITSILKSSGLSVNNFQNNMDMINQCRNNGYFTNVEDTFFIILNKYRNSACHRYKQPTVEDIKLFYENKRGQILFILSDLERITKEKN